MPAGKTALVTGANSGIGIAIAMHMASLAAKVVLVGRRRERGLSVVREIERRGGIGQYVEADVSERGVPDRIVEQIASRHGRLDILVNDAGVIYRGAAPECSGDCQEFRVWAGIMGKWESQNVSTQRACDTKRSS